MKNTSDTEQPLEEKPSRLNSIVFENLSPDYPKINAFSHFIGWASIFVVLLILNFFVKKVNLPAFILPFIGTLSILSAFYGYYSAKACGYFIGEFDILYKEGLWWKKQTALSFSRIQHIDISHGPIEREYQIATIKFFTAGGIASDLKISGLLNHVAESLRADILRITKYEFDIEQESSKNTIQIEKENGENVPAGIKND
ncbi:MAG: PH domain-containing protein [Gammaproteobacteria bacterium]|nr:PH domain-containing protein [Gammaproteobacteria bacterium]